MNKVMVVIWGIAMLCIGGFLGGGYGWHLMDNRCGELIDTVAPANDSFYLKKHIAAIDALEAGDTIKARGIISMVARSEAESIRNCADSSNCRGLARDKVADKALLERAMTLP